MYFEKSSRYYVIPIQTFLNIKNILNLWLNISMSFALEIKLGNKNFLNRQIVFIGAKLSYL